jgi:DNA-directed RNA polymerase subunit RPC12/RpoP
MTRFCIRCNRIIGEKCIRCGVEAISGANGHAVAGAGFECPSCGHHFLQGDGGTTGGMCEPCFDDALQKARKPAPKSELNPAGLRPATGRSLPGRRPASLRPVAKAVSNTLT